MELKPYIKIKTKNWWDMVLLVTMWIPSILLEPLWFLFVIFARKSKKKRLLDQIWKGLFALILRHHQIKLPQLSIILLLRMVWCSASLYITRFSCLVCHIFYNILYDVGNLSRKLSTASSLGSMEESYFLQASLDSSDSFSERRNPGELSMSPYYMKSMTPSSFEAALRQKEGELASYMSRLVWFVAFIL